MRRSLGSGVSDGRFRGEGSKASEVESLKNEEKQVQAPLKRGQVRGLRRS